MLESDVKKNAYKIEIIKKVERQRNMTIQEEN